MFFVSVEPTCLRVTQFEKSPLKTGVIMTDKFLEGMWAQEHQQNENLSIMKNNHTTHSPCNLCQLWCFLWKIFWLLCVQRIMETFIYNESIWGEFKIQISYPDKWVSEAKSHMYWKLQKNNRFCLHIGYGPWQNFTKKFVLFLF